MPVDLRLNLSTKDLILDGHQDLAIVDGEDLVNQRIFTRLTIARGTFLYDRVGTLGSALRAALNQSDPAARKAAAVQLIYDALSPMTDISITNVIVNDVFLDNSQKLKLQAIVQWVPSSDTGSPVFLNSDSNPVVIEF